MKKKPPLLLLAILLAQTIFAQADSLFLQTAFQGRLASNAGDVVFNGRQHVPYSTSIEGIPYYSNDAWQSGTLVYQDERYRDVFLKYDLVADEVVIRHLNTFAGVVLFTPRISSFTLDKKRFVNLPGDGGEIKAGIYEELSKGKLSLYAKRSKLLEENIVGTSIVQKVTDRIAYYVGKEGRYFRVNKEKDILRLDGDKKDELKGWLKASPVTFKTDPEAAMVRLVDHYNQLSR